MERPFKDKRPLGPFVSGERVSRIKGTKSISFDRSISPLVVIRKFHEEINSGTKDGEIVADWGTLSWSGDIFAHVEFGFHEKYADNTFEFKPEKNARAGGSIKQGTSLVSMGGKAGEFAKLFNDIYGSEHWEFASLDAASLGNMYLTSYEFEYVNSIERAKIKRIELEERLKEVI